MVRDGAPAQGTVNLAFPELTPVTVLLFSSDPGVASVPATAIVPAGASSVTFTISTNAAAPPTIVQIMAAVQNVPRTANLSVNAATPGRRVSSRQVSVTPTSVTGGSAATGTVPVHGDHQRRRRAALEQQPGGRAGAVRRPSSTAARRPGAFAVTTSPVSATTTVTITARWFGVTRTTPITVRAGAPAPADVVRITRASWEPRPAADRGHEHQPERDPVRPLALGRLHVHAHEPRRRPLLGRARLGRPTRARSRSAATSAAARPRT